MTDTLDPLRTSELIGDTYRRYLRSLLPIRDRKIASALDAQITNSDLLAKGPFLEATPPYETGATLEELIAEGVLDPGFRAFGSTALPLDRPLYLHQEQAIRKAASERNVVVATGTGSGKTESFLLPVLNRLAAEHRAGTLGPGVRALLLYPMNALANDQMKRLRRILAQAPHITFGRYVGDTKEHTERAEQSFEVLNPGEQLLPNELLSREQMRATPPHLLLTNYAMLEYLLLRPADLDLFEGEHGGHWRFIVVDEAHVYDGAKAAEVAMLLRRLRDRVAPDRPLQCLATSATVGDDRHAVTRFAERLFDARFEWVAGDPSRQDLVGPTRRREPPGPYWGPLGAPDYRKLAELPDPEAEIVRLAAEHGAGRGTAADLLAREQRMVDLRALLSARPQLFGSVAAALFAPDELPQESLAALVAVGSRVTDESGTPVLSARYHLFTRATEGAYTCLSDSGPHVSLGRRERCADCSAAAFEFGACQRCGAVYLTGHVRDDQGRLFFVPRTRPDETPAWLLLGDHPVVVDEDDQTFEDNPTTLNSDEALLCSGCGGLHVGRLATCCSGARLWEVRKLTRSGSPRGCLACGAGAKSRTIRKFESGQDAAAAVVSTALYQALPPAPDESVADHPGEGRKLLLFSDSRQKAAFFAPYLQRTYGDLQRRRLIWQGLLAAVRDGDVARVDDLAAEVAKAATREGIFERRASRQAKQRETTLWVMRELIPLDDRQSLEGRGLLRVTMERDPRWRLPGAFTQLGLDEEESWALLAELVRTLRQQGALTMPEDVDPADEAFDPRRGPIFVRSKGAEAARKVLSWSPTRGVNRRLDYVRRVLAALGSDADPAQVLDGCFTALSRQREGWLVGRQPPQLGVVYQVDHTWLSLEVGSSLFRCTLCRRVAPVSVRGVCPTLGCTGTLEPYEVPEIEQDDDHYRTLYRTMKPVPLTASEHTAQWTSQTAAEIQQRFVRGEVNALSCSTTFELGVDVGELQSVMMRNMPPTTANYVQRAGRAGRRTASAALVVTYAQRTSHDLSRYQNPVDMIAGRVRAPHVPLGNERIDRRHAHSVALAAFFRHAKRMLGREWKTAGEFFLPGPDGGDAPVTLVRGFLDPVPEQVRRSLERVLPKQVREDLGVAEDRWATEMVRLLDEVRRQLQHEVSLFEEKRDKAAAERRFKLADQCERTINTLRKRSLLGFLANHNILPKYGFPVDTVELRTSHTGSLVGESLELARDLSSAIYEYAPGAQIVAGGKLWTSAGVYRLPDRELDGQNFMICRACGFFHESRDELERSCPACDALYEGAPRHYVVPEFGFIASKRVQNPGMQPPERSWNGATYVLRLADEVEELTWELANGGRVVTRAGAPGRLIAVSEGVGRSGYWICDSCGWGQAMTGRMPRTHNHPFRDTECRGTLRVHALAHPYETDILELSFDMAALPHQDSVTLNSLVTAILEGAADQLQISRDDIDGTLYPHRGGRRALVIYDTVPGGAGNAVRIARALDEVLPSALERVQLCDCGEETSCYGCLRNFRNQWIHDQLRRGRALDVLRRMVPAVRVGDDTPEAQANTGTNREAPRSGLGDRVAAGTMLFDTRTGLTGALVLEGGQVLLHGVTYPGPEEAAAAVEHDADAATFWAADLPEGRIPLGEL
ncbi:DEAD/DEAH box helicase [Actinomadura miaoliensis]|uniref:DEAD/DEAH box helicase n=1 Tax=Actinomadura miaoliensis TaxID=430685 RepID=A0ABP7W4Y4_9ACTN